MDFRNGTNQDVEYLYDENGNLIKDLNKSIADIQYNLLNLPKRITFNDTNKSTHEYIYSADGKKLSVIHKSSAENRTDYVGNMIYENGSLKRILVDGGYIENGTYYFYLQDHLGNNRVVAKSDGTVIQTNHYYPFGMSFTESTHGDKQPYKYNNKELDMNNGLNWYDYDARQMEVVSGRFTSIDPMAEKYYSWSPYSYCLGNPIKFVDPTGTFTSPYYTEDGTFLGVDEKGFTGAIYITNKATFDKYSNKGVADSKKIQGDKNTVPLKTSVIELASQAHIYTDVLKKSTDAKLDMSGLYKGEVSIVDDVVRVGLNEYMGKGYNDPYGHKEKPKYSTTYVKGKIRVTVESGYNQHDLYTVESIQNYLGVHEYYGHGIMNWSKTSTHWKCYNAQLNHPTFKKLPKYQQDEIKERYNLYYSKRGK